MEKTSTNSLGFNKRKAEGRGKRDTHKTFPLKVPKHDTGNTLSYIQILGIGMDTQDTLPSVLLFFDNHRFIFNSGEGFQRYCSEHRIRLSKIDHIFHTRVSSETVGGLPGLLLTLAGNGKKGMSVKIWGSFDLEYLMNAILSFIPNGVVHTTYFGPQPMRNFTDPIVLIDDEVVKISAILIRRPLGTLLPHSNSPKRNGAPVLKLEDISVIYICELPEIKGKFDRAKAMALGLEPGPNYQKLKDGIEVYIKESNITIYPNEVVDPSIPGPIVLIVDCPTLDHLQELLSIQSLTPYYSDSVCQQLQGPKSVNCIVHLSPSSVTMTATYQLWMKQFGGGAQHIMAGHEVKNMEIPILRASSRIVARLNYLCPQFFPASGFQSSQHLNDFVPDSSGSSEGCIPNLCDSFPAENLLKFHLRPYSKLGLDTSEVPNLLSQKEVINELISEIPEIVDYKEQVSQLWDDEFTDNKRAPLQKNIVIHEDKHGCAIPSCLEDVTREDMEIVLLGTGSSQPSKYRNVSSIYVNLFSKGGLLLDTGEGTLGQLRKRYGEIGANAAVRSLRCIWISHIHADHQAGLSSILLRRRDMLRGTPHERLLVIGPCLLKRYLDAFQKFEDLDMHFLDCRQTTKASFESSLELSEILNDNAISINKLKKVLEEMGLESLVSVPVVHCPHAFGIVVKAAERENIVGKTIPGWKLAYSGDTRPCLELINAARDATILIHEATFESGMVEDAITKNHSTIDEAIEVGDSANAYRIILTHFSQRYPKIPVLDDAHMHNTCIAFDLMSINIADLPLLPKVLTYLKLLFRNEMVPIESEDIL